MLQTCTETKRARVRRAMVDSTAAGPLVNMWRQVTFTMLMVHVLTPTPLAAAQAATQVIERLHAELLAVMKGADELGYSGRYDRLGPVVTSSYDLPFIARVVVGTQWKDFSDEQKSEFVAKFTKLSIATYARRFDGYSGERFEVLSEEAVRVGRILVKSVLLKPNGEKVQLDYLLHQVGDQWRIINVIAEGVSDLSLKRADYSSYLKKNGFDALVDRLDQKIGKYSE